MNDHKEKIIQLHKEGKSYRQIQEILGCSKGTISYHLGKGQKEKSNTRRQESAKKFKKRIAKIKEDSGCIDCKNKFPHYMLHFDHLPERGEKIAGIYRTFKTHGLKIALEEIEKCEVVCANCHSKRTWQRKPW